MHLPLEIVTVWTILDRPSMDIAGFSCPTLKAYFSYAGPFFSNHEWFNRAVIRKVRRPCDNSYLSSTFITSDRPLNCKMSGHLGADASPSHCDVSISMPKHFSLSGVWLNSVNFLHVPTLPLMSVTTHSSDTASYLFHNRICFAYATYIPPPILVFFTFE